MVSSVAVNELIIRNLRSIQRIEASNRAYMAAEAGVEDALYELTPHFAGYQTPALTDTAVRKVDFENKGKCDSGDFCNKWTIESRSGQSTWTGKIYGNQKLAIPIYYDKSDENPSAQNIPINSIYNYTFAPTDINAFFAVDLNITFKIPDGDKIIQIGGLEIDNDEDGLLNEDPIGINQPAGYNPSNPEDDDKDGQVDEDNDEDAVILWKLTDGGEMSLTPKKGCIEEIDPLKKGSEPCESDFDSGSTPEPYSVTLDFNDKGINEVGDEETIGQFITRAKNGAVSPPTPGNDNAKIQLELLIIAPMEHMDSVSSKKFNIPYIEYEVNSNLTSNKMPYPYFTIKSDGYYRGFKQSITSTVSPKTTVPLFDFTIIQQE